MDGWMDGWMNGWIDMHGIHIIIFYKFLFDKNREN